MQIHAPKIIILLSLVLNLIHHLPVTNPRILIEQDKISQPVLHLPRVLMIRNIHLEWRVARLGTLLQSSWQSEIAKLLQTDGIYCRKFSTCEKKFKITYLWMIPSLYLLYINGSQILLVVDLQDNFSVCHKPAEI